MICERVRSLIDAYTTDELDLPAALEVEGHLAACPACASELESLQELRRTVGRASLRYAAPSDLRRRVSVELNNHNSVRDPASRTRINRFALAAAIAVLLLVPWAAIEWNASR